MPDDLIPTTETAAPEPAETISAPAVKTPTDSEAVYTEAFSETMAEDDEAGGDQGDEGGPGSEIKAQEPAKDKEVEASPDFVLTYSQEEAIKRAKLDPSLLSSLPRENVEAFVSQLIESQSAQDRLGAELARLKGSEPQEIEEEEEDDPPARSKGPISDRIKKTFASLSEHYDDTLDPIATLLGEMESQFSQAQTHSNMVPAMAQLMSDVVLDMTLEHLKADYPSLKTPDARKRVEDRFWTEWNTGAYSRMDKPLREQIREAALNAAKVTFHNTTEQAAVLNLVNKNKAIVSAQPKVGPSKAPPRPVSEDDMYNKAFANTLGPELARSR